MQQTVFVYDNGKVVLQFDQSGSDTLDAADLSHRYLWGPAVDQALADEQVDWADTDADGPTLWALADHLGTVRDIADSSGAVVNHRNYDAFGALVSETNAAKDFLFGYTGKAFDERTGLQNNLNRWYDPAVGRWLSEDPISFAAGDANLSRYVGNAVTGAVDPDGLIAAAAAAPIVLGGVTAPAWAPAVAVGAAGAFCVWQAHDLGVALEERFGVGEAVGAWWAGDGATTLPSPPGAIPLPGPITATPEPFPDIQGVSKRQSQRRREIGIECDPDVPIPNLGQGPEGGWGGPAGPPKTGPKTPKGPKPRHGPGQRGDHTTPRPPMAR